MPGADPCRIDVPQGRCTAGCITSRRCEMHALPPPFALFVCHNTVLLAFAPPLVLLPPTLQCGIVTSTARMCPCRQRRSSLTMACVVAVQVLALLVGGLGASVRSSSGTGASSTRWPTPSGARSCTSSLARGKRARPTPAQAPVQRLQVSSQLQAAQTPRFPLGLWLRTSIWVPARL